jgi:predicted ATPase/DNA-binding SARP family transcriptional activator/Tfp pilus assembly protein PilF
MPLTLQLFGALTLHRDSVPLPRPRIRKDHWLLALLALRSDRDTDRNFLAGTFWPDIDESQALFYLRRSLNELRRMLGPDAPRLTAPSPRTLRLDIRDMEVDVLAFDAALKRGDAGALELAVGLYRGDLLEGCDELWVGPERETRREAYVGALHRLAMDRVASDPSAAVDYLRRAVAADFLNELVQRALLETLVARGDFASAQQAYREFRLRLREEMQSDPAPETTALYQQIRARARKGPVMPPRASDKGTIATSASSSERDSEIRTVSPPTNLSEPLTSFIGREKEVGEAMILLEKSRLLTLTGTGGVGKTRLALQVAREALEEYADGVWLVELASLADPTLVTQTVAMAVGVREAVGMPLLQTLTEYLKPKRLLLVLDNCEHLIAACARLTDTLLRSCPHLKILASSREALGIQGEQRLTVPALSLPESQANPSWERLQGYEAVRLFVERASLVRPDFAVTSVNAQAVVSVCRRLDGLPLALELAAARVRGLTVEAISTRLEDRFLLLSGGSRTSPTRQQTLRALMDWSYDLLCEEEQIMLKRLSVFVGGWTLEAAERVVCAGAATGSGHSAAGAEPAPSILRIDEVLDLLLSLVDKSLIMVEETDSGTRYRLLETVRAYALERLKASDKFEVSDEMAAVRMRHRQWCAEFVEAADPHLKQQAVWLDRVEAEHDNLRAALAGGSDQLAFRIGSEVWWFWYVRGYWSEGRERLIGLLQAESADVGRTQKRAQVQIGAGVLAHCQGDYSAARTLYKQSYEIFQEIQDRRGVARTLMNLGSLAKEQSEYSAARELYEESLAAWREIGDEQGAAATFGNLGIVAQHQGDYSTAREMYERCLEIRRRIGNGHPLATTLNNLGTLAYDEGDYSMARGLYRESLEIRREIGDRMGVATTLLNLGMAAARQGDHIGARAQFTECLEICREIGDRSGVEAALINLGNIAVAQEEYGVAHGLYEESLRICQEIKDQQGTARCLEGMANLRSRQGDAATAVRLWAMSQALREVLGMPMPPIERDALDRQINEARTILGAEGFAAAWQEGRAMDREHLKSTLPVPGATLHPIAAAITRE